MKPLVLGLMVVVLSLGWAGPSEAGGRGRGHGGGHHKGAYYRGGGHHGGYYGGHYYRHGHHRHHDHDDYYYAALLLYGAPLVLSVLTGWNHPRATARAPSQAVGYVEQPGYWYYCTDPEGYHPYVKDCPQGWLQVVPSGPPR
jgi:hypothetical protein